jgi:4-hydroxybenzoate polyprenyltransferase
MSKLSSFIRLVRLPNLIMILFVQYMVRFAFLYPVFKISGLKLQMNEGMFFMFSIAFLFMAAGGYIINDYNDIEIDKINKPTRMVIGNGYTAPEAQELYWIISLTGVVIGFWSCFEMGLPSLGILFFIYLTGLWFYSTTFKYNLLIGNIVISIFLALVPFASALVEVFADVKKHYWADLHGVPSLIYNGILVISLFAFLLNLARELVKDAEDMEGDAKAGCRTVPIIWGLKATKALVGLVLICIVGALSKYSLKLYDEKDWLSLGYIIGFILVPILVIMIGLFIASAPKQFHRISTWLKLLMVLGISYLFVFAFILLTNYDVK